MPECRFAIRYQRSAGHDSASGAVVGNDVFRSLAAPIGTSVTSSTGSVERAGLGWRGATTCSSSAVHSGMRRARAVIVSGVPSSVNGLSPRARPVERRRRDAAGRVVASAVASPVTIARSA
ncbi:hypothetical protein GCM10010221_59200 [Streptomyces parvus]|nr:hypothetical protein GCM10010221_59200 [Streptomyces parvus]